MCALENEHIAKLPSEKCKVQYIPLVYPVHRDTTTYIDALDVFIQAYRYINMLFAHNLVSSGICFPGLIEINQIR